MSGQNSAGTRRAGSCDFVRKLFRILNDAELRHIVQWGLNGNSFIIYDVEQFSRVALQSYFKHRNFNSFVRQLNKYDFHKVRQSLDEQSPNHNPDACEFRHTCFRRDGRDLLDRIKRKQPASRRPKESLEYDNLVRQTNTLHSQVAGLQQRMEQIDRSYAALAANLTTTIQLVLHLADQLETLKSNSQPVFPFDLADGSMPMRSNASHNYVPQELSVEQWNDMLPRSGFSMPPTNDAGNWLNAAAGQQDNCQMNM